MELTKEQAWELCLLALAIEREASGEPFLGKVAVGWSIRNRVMMPGKTWWGDNWEEVILKPWQYTSFMKSDPNATKIPGDPAKDRSWADSLQAAVEAYNGIGEDPTNGATHYYNPKAVASKPAWVNAAGSVFLCVIGAHHFYRAA